MEINKIHISNIIDTRRMDPIFFRFGTSRFGVKYKLASIGSISIDLQSGFGAGKREQADEDNGTIHVRPTNLDNNGNLIFEKNVYVPFSLNKPTLEFNDVLFNNTNSQELVGKTAIFKDDKQLFFSNHITRIRVDKNFIIPDYLWIILNIYQREKIFFSICTNWNNQSGVGLELLKSIMIPLPPLEIQTEIVDLYTKTQNEKQAKEQKAKELLDSIGIYLLEQLNIPLPEKQERQLSFKVSISSVIGQRLDVSFYRDRFELKSVLYSNSKLSDIVEVNPSINFKSLKNNDQISFIPMEVIDEIFGEIAEKRETTIANTKGFTKFKEGDLLWAKITPCMQNGKSAIASNLTNGIGCGSTEFYVLRPKTESVSTEYIYCLLRHHKVLEAAKNSFGGSAGQQRVSSGYLKSIMIPVPPKEKQIEIAKEIAKRKNKAKLLQQEGELLLNEAKSKIKKIILG